MKFQICKNLKCMSRTVTPRRPRNADLRTREYLTEAEVERLTNAAKGNRWGNRDVTMILMANRMDQRSLIPLDCNVSQPKTE